jgi:hypothetical protein
MGPQTSECTSSRRVRRMAECRKMRSMGRRSIHKCEGLIRTSQVTSDSKLLNVKTRNALAYSAEKIGGHGTDAAGDDVGGANVFAVAAIDGHDVA